MCPQGQNKSILDAGNLYFGTIHNCSNVQKVCFYDLSLCFVNHIPPKRLFSSIFSFPVIFSVLSGCPELQNKSALSQNAHI